MTRLAVAIMVRSLDQAHAAAAVAAEHGADLVEYRVDTFTDDLPALTALVERSALPCIVTCRPTWEGGEYGGDEAMRLAVFEHACAGARRPAYLDVELVAYERSADFRSRIDAVVDHPDEPATRDTGLIVSSHDFTSRPRDLYQRVTRIASIPTCRIVKVAWMARSLRDNIEAFELQASRVKPTIALCMGEHGLPSRVLAKKFGAFLTFAAPAPGIASQIPQGAATSVARAPSVPNNQPTAPGQPTLNELKSFYRWDTITPHTRVFGVVGHPVGHSMSPAIHNAGFDATGFDGVYLPMPIEPSYESFKATILTWLDHKPLHFRGASVTIPHKANLLRFVEERGGQVEPLAKRIGAANTLTVHDDGSLTATNTDYAAALDAVCDSLGIDREGLADRQVAVIGAGGAARAIVAGYAQYGSNVTIFNRTADKAQGLAESFQDQPGDVTASPLDALHDAPFDVLINCTPIGMHPETDDSPLPDGAQSFGNGVVVFDTIYNPIQTRLLRDAQAAGCTTITGVEMFVRQAADQFKAWTQHDAPTDVFRNVVTARLT